MTHSEFSVRHEWTSTSTRTPVRWLASHLFRNKLIILLVLLSAAGNAALAAVLPVLTGVAFAAVFTEQPNLALLLRASLLLIGTQAVRATLQLGRNFGSELLGQRLERNTRQELYASLLGKSMAFHDCLQTGDIMARAASPPCKM